MARPKSKTQIVVLYHNITTSAGKLGRGDQVLLPRDEAKAIVEMDEEAGREARIVIVENLQ